MRFNNRACALMDIPDLPQGAFEHIGDRKIKPQGGGNPISAITDPISDVLGTSGGGGGILGAAEDLVQGAGSALADVDKFVGREIPGGWVTVGAATVPFLAPEVLAMAAPEAAFTGMTETGLATLAGEGALADTVGATLLSNAAAEAAVAEAIGQALPYTEAFDAVNLAQQGLSANQIAQNLTVSGLDSFLAEDMARLAAQGLSPQQIAETLAYSYTPAELAGTGIESKALGAAKKGLTAGQAVQAARLGMGLLGGAQQQPQPQQQQMMIGGRQTNPYGGIDYSGLLNLLQPRMASRNSLLG
jgi:hypothetical protein